MSSLVKKINPFSRMFFNLQRYRVVTMILQFR